MIVALVALYVQFGVFRPNGPLWALIASAPLVPLLDRLLPGERYDWAKPTCSRSAATMTECARVPPSLNSLSRSEPRRFL